MPTVNCSEAIICMVNVCGIPVLGYTPMLNVAV